MSYCVNCGVELDKSEKYCPLCGVEVINPLQPYDEKAIRPYPKRLDPINAKINRQFIASILSIVFVFPALLCLAINLSLDSRLSWSLYVAGALVLAWTMVVPFYLFRKPFLTGLFIPDLVALLLYLLLIATLQQDANWYLTLALPLVLLTAGLVYLNAFLILHQILRGFVIPAAILVSISLLVMGVEWIVELFLYGFWRLGWSFYVLIPCLALAMVCLTIARRQSIREEIKKRLHL
ncbi:MAG: zinc ribbon domain-containing protein [Clostridiaceae bacterium]|nr:zinc ribbon domain-containing protein [Clostridiaceae bacterium]